MEVLLHDGKGKQSTSVLCQFLTTRGWYGCLPNSFLVFVSDSRFRALDSLQLFHQHFSYFTSTSAISLALQQNSTQEQQRKKAKQQMQSHFSYFTSTSAISLALQRKQNCRKIAENCRKIARSHKTTRRTPPPLTIFLHSVIFHCLLGCNAIKSTTIMVFSCLMRL